MKPSFVRWMAVPVVLAALGYRPRDFAVGTEWLFTSARAALTLGLALLGGVFSLSRRATHRQRQQLIRLLEATRTGQPLPLLTGDGMAEGSYARLADEIQKAVTELSLTRQAAVRVWDRFVQNLANIAHQLETPLTALSLAAQSTGVDSMAAPLARLDTGALSPHSKPCDLLHPAPVAGSYERPYPVFVHHGPVSFPGIFPLPPWGSATALVLFSAYPIRKILATGRQ